MQKKTLKSRFDILRLGKTALPDNMTDETLLTRTQAVALVGCSLRTLIMWIDERGLREVKIGKFSRIRKRELDRFLDENNKELEIGGEELRPCVYVSPCFTGRSVGVTGADDESTEESDDTERIGLKSQIRDDIWQDELAENPDTNYEAFLEEFEVMWKDPDTKNETRNDMWQAALADDPDADYEEFLEAFEEMWKEE